MYDYKNMYQDKFTCYSRECNGEQFRKIITDVEEYGFYLLSYMIYTLFNITTNQEWFDKNVKSILDDKYGKELADATYRYMHIPEDLNKKITNHDFSDMNSALVSKEEYINMYKFMVENMRKIDHERIELENKNKK